MRKLAWWLVLMLTLTLAFPVLAEDEEEEEEEPGALAEYGAEVGNRYLMGVTSIATFLGDPPMEAAFPEEDFNELPGAVVTKHVVGLGAGLLLSVFRASMGTLDLLFAPLTPMKMLSPEMRWNLFDIEHDQY